MENCVIKYADVNVDNIVFDTFAMATDGKHVVSRIWYEQKSSITNSAKRTHPQSFYIQTQALEICESLNTENDDLLLILNDASLFEKLDAKAVSEIRLQQAHKKYGLIRPTYKSSVDTRDENNNIETLRLKIGNCKFFYKNKTPRSLNDVLNLSLLQKGSFIKVIIEVNVVMMNIEQNFIFTNFVLKQAQIIPPIPKYVELTEFSFIDDEPVQSEVNIDDVILNTQTEYGGNNHTADNMSADELVCDTEHNNTNNSVQNVTAPISTISQITTTVPIPTKNTLSPVPEIIQQHIQQHIQQKPATKRGRPPRNTVTPLKKPEKKVLEIINLAVDNDTESDSESESASESDDSSSSSTSESDSESENTNTLNSPNLSDNYNSADVNEFLEHLNKIEPQKSRTNAAPKKVTKNVIKK